LAIKTLHVRGTLFQYYNDGDPVRMAGIWGIAFVGRVVWAHHRYTTGLEVDTVTYFSILTRVIAIPTGAKIYNYRRTYRVSYV